MVYNSKSYFCWRNRVPLKCDFDVNNLPIHQANFHRQALLLYIGFFYSNIIFHQLIWNNKNVKIRTNQFSTVIASKIVF